MTSLAVLTSGGDAPGMNAAILAVTKVAAAQGAQVWGVENGFDGLVDGEFRPLTQSRKSGRRAPIAEIEDSAGLGGTVLGSRRSRRFHKKEARVQAVEHLMEYSVDGLVVIGGDGTMAGAHALADETDIGVVGIPASIDNDIGLTREALGVDSALNTIVDICDRISDTARSHHRAFIVEVMGRSSGYLAMAASVATAADAVLMPEKAHTRDQVMESVTECIRSSFDAGRGKTRVLVIKAEGVPVPTHELVDEVAARLGDTDEYDIRGTVLGHVVRGGNASYRDRLLAGRFGLTAVDALLDATTDVMTGWNIGVETGEPTSDDWIRLFPLSDVLAESESLKDGTSPISIDRVRRMEAIQGVLAL